MIVIVIVLVILISCCTLHQTPQSFHNRTHLWTCLVCDTALHEHHSVPPLRTVVEKLVSCHTVLEGAR